MKTMGDLEVEGNAYHEMHGAIDRRLIGFSPAEWQHHILKWHWLPRLLPNTSRLFRDIHSEQRAREVQLAQDTYGKVDEGKLFVIRYLFGISEFFETRMRASQIYAMLEYLENQGFIRVEALHYLEAIEGDTEAAVEEAMRVYGIDIRTQPFYWKIHVNRWCYEVQMRHNMTLLALSKSDPPYSMLIDRPDDYMRNSRKKHDPRVEPLFYKPRPVEVTKLLQRMLDDPDLIRHPMVDKLR